MADLWGTLVPLIVASAIVPLHLAITQVFVRSSARVAIAWLAGITTVRVVQGLVFGLMFSTSLVLRRSDNRKVLVGGILLVFAVILYTTALRKALMDQDEDPPPPKWKERAASIGPFGAFWAGVALMSVGVKFWVFTLGAIGAIIDAQIGWGPGIATFLAFVVLAQSGHLLLIGFGVASSDGSSTRINALSDWLKRRNRIVTIVLGFVFGTWFLVKALSLLGVM